MLKLALKTGNQSLTYDVGIFVSGIQSSQFAYKWMFRINELKILTSTIIKTYGCKYEKK